MKRWWLVLRCVLLTGCLDMPDGIQPMQNECIATTKRAN